MYEIVIAEEAAGFIRKQTKKVQRQILGKIEQLSSNPHPQGSEPLKSFPDLYRIRSGDYRIVYKIDNKQIKVLVLKVGRRSDIYKRL